MPVQHSPRKRVSLRACTMKPIATVTICGRAKKARGWEGQRVQLSLSRFLRRTVPMNAIRGVCKRQNRSQRQPEATPHRSEGEACRRRERHSQTIIHSPTHHLETNVLAGKEGCRFGRSSGNSRVRGRGNGSAFVRRGPVGLAGVGAVDCGRTHQHSVDRREASWTHTKVRRAMQGRENGSGGLGRRGRRAADGRRRGGRWERWHGTAWRLRESAARKRFKEESERVVLGVTHGTHLDSF